MVGVPRSKGCSLCVQRRVKCDEGRPSCGNCIRYKVDCPGYEKKHKFVDTKHTVKPRAPKRSRQLNTREENPPPIFYESTLVLHQVSNPVTDSTCDTLSKSDTEREEYLIYTRQCFTFNPPSARGRVPTTNRAQYITTMIDSIRVAEASIDLMFFEHWFEGLPPRLGSKASLDSSTCALILHLLGKSKKDERLLSESHQMYGQSLAELQRAVVHSTEWKSSETLCSAMLLGLYELFAGTAPGGWRKHVNGVSQLIQCRGSKSFKNEWDHGLLLSFRGLLIATSAFQFQECFLAKKPWRALCSSANFHKDYFVHLAGSGEMVFLSIVDEYLMSLADLTLIFKPIHGYLTGLNHGLDIDSSQKTALEASCNKKLSAYQGWYDRVMGENMSPLLVEIPSNDSESIFPVVLKFSNPWIGTVFLGFWACSFLYKLTLARLNPNKYAHFEAEAEKHRLDIMKSLETIGKGLSGAYRTGFIIRLVFEFSPHIEQVWLKGVLRRFKPLYGAVNPDAYPPPRIHPSSPDLNSNCPYILQSSIAG